MKRAGGTIRNVFVIGAAGMLIGGAGALLFGSDPYVNPLRGDLGVHDPVMIKEGATYRIYSTGRLVGSKSSTDRINWRGVSSGLTAPSWVRTEVPDNSGTDFWAPDISFRDNKYWLYYSVSTFGKNTSAIGLATSPTLSSPTWTDQGVVVKSTSSSNYNCIDPNVFQDVDGRVWLTFGSFWSGIKLVELDPATGKPATDPPELLAIASRSRGGIEAPFIVKWGYYYLFVSWDRCCQGVNSTYKIVAGRATQVTGPYQSKDGTLMTSSGGEVLDTGDAVRIGPGHNGIFIEHDTVFCVNHYYDATRNGASILQIRPLFWDDGWPSFTGTRTGPPAVDVRRVPIAAPSGSGTRAPDCRRYFAAAGAMTRIPAQASVYTISGKRVSRSLLQGANAISGRGAAVYIVDSQK
ncbi:MAG: arabinan endo-1,5-alpha-L-arabinosidase [Chitinispirillaceae bacterium]|nr:arabinan endo-1,5-alpha-L-arabinosidase [Chitinispirillaceae bacterium]